MSTPWENATPTLAVFRIVPRVLDRLGGLDRPANPVHLRQVHHGLLALLRAGGAPRPGGAQVLLPRERGHPAAQHGPARGRCVGLELFRVFSCVFMRIEGLPLRSRSA